MSRIKANLLLLLAAALWGVGNVPQKAVLDHLDPISVVGLCSLLGGLIVAPLMLFERRGAGGKAWWASILKITLLLALAVSIQQTARLTTTATNVAFLVNTCTVMTPIAAWLLLRERPGVTVAAGALMTLAGALLLAGGIPGIGSPGDLASVLSAACYAVWMVELGQHMRTHGRPFTTAAAQFLGTAAITLPLGLHMEQPTLQAVIGAAPDLIFIAVFATALPIMLQTVAQRYTTASHAAVIVSGEALFAAAAAALFLGERLSPGGLVGAAVIFAAILLVATSAARQEAGVPDPARRGFARRRRIDIATETRP